MKEKIEDNKGVIRRCESKQTDNEMANRLKIPQA